MNILVSGSLAYDRIMDFPGRFSDHIIPDKIHVLNVCFMIDGLKENFGGTAGNIAYALSLLGESPAIIATAGHDFEAYRSWLMKNKISLEHIRIIEEELTAGAYITTDKSDNQITAFNPGAMKFSADFNADTFEPEKTIAIIAPGNLDDMIILSEVYKKKKIDYIFDPGQSLPALSRESLAAMIQGSKIFICNDYELQLTREKISMTTEEILKRTEILIVTKGEFGSVIMREENNSVKTYDIPAAKACKIADPTGAGDAYRAGMIKGLAISKDDIVHAAKIGSVCAVYAVEVYGSQNFHFTPESFNRRFEDVFGMKAF
ncbi:MAG: carbohydrate kinase family protein [Candidatus Loosdrechtia sp.]|uniref:carbohydrate kinase family protein n=1 Tax=Candidatus Loosdrechtia sp. TaxID=3101272 RepID=UPI003A5DF35C|nr:MAG: carbohydrate kinase family protein [Candidatus Jettenia sp. AMX2]